MFVRTLPDDAKNALAVLGRSKALDFAYMAGGTALALQLGHRRSVDFDFFCKEKFDEEEITEKLKVVGDYEMERQAVNTMQGHFNGVSFSLFWYKHPLISESVDIGGINLASVEDIAAMKFQATLGRATKKDYIDIYFLIKKCFPVENMFEYYDRKYGTLENNKLMLVNGLQYFEDAETSEMPVMFEGVSWSEVKNFLRQESERLWRE